MAYLARGEGNASRSCFVFCAACASVLPRIIHRTHKQNSVPIEQHTRNRMFKIRCSCGACLCKVIRISLTHHLEQMNIANPPSARVQSNRNLFGGASIKLKHTPHLMAARVRFLSFLFGLISLTEDKGKRMNTGREGGGLMLLSLFPFLEPFISLHMPGRVMARVESADGTHKPRRIGAQKKQARLSSFSMCG